MGLLTKDEYLATFVEPMQRLEADESYKPVPMASTSPSASARSSRLWSETSYRSNMCT
jgi:hypothetical protein